MVKIVVDRGRCIGAANCLVRAPRVFALDGTRKAYVMDPLGAADDVVIEAAKACPTEAIRLFDERTGEPIFP